MASNLTTLQRAGVQVVWFSLFARDKDTHGGPDVVRSVADHVVLKQLRAAGFFGAGGRLVDQWPLYASYFGLVGSRPGAPRSHAERATFGTRTNDDKSYLWLALRAAALAHGVGWRGVQSEPERCMLKREAPSCTTLAVRHASPHLASNYLTIAEGPGRFGSIVRPTGGHVKATLRT